MSTEWELYCVDCATTLVKVGHVRSIETSQTPDEVATVLGGHR